MPTKPPYHNIVRQKIKTYFLTGLLVFGPIGLTLFVVDGIISWMDDLVAGLFPEHLQPDAWFGFHIPGIGLLMSILLIFLVGLLTANFLGRSLIQYSERLLYQIPLVKSIYTLFKQVANTTIGKDRKGFRQVVLLEYPRQGIWTIGFVTGVTEGEIQRLIPEQVVNVFVPTTPNPTSGFILMVPEKDTIPLSMSVEDAFKLVVSGGMVTPKDKNMPEQHSLPDTSSQTPSIRMP